MPDKNLKKTYEKPCLTKHEQLREVTLRSGGRPGGGGPGGGGPGGGGPGGGGSC